MTSINMTYKAICQDCKELKLKQIGVKMSVGIGYFKVGKCSECNADNQHLFSYSEEPSNGQ